MNVFPLKFGRLSDGNLLFTYDAGGYFKSGEDFLGRYARDRLDDRDHEYLAQNGHSYLGVDDPSFNAFMYRWANRLYAPVGLDYVILVPTRAAI